MDLKKIRKRVKGKAYHFGSHYNNHLFLFHGESSYKSKVKDQTLEILIYNSDTIKDTNPETIDFLKKNLQKAFIGFEIQDHIFKPTGYSLNAVKGESYFTVHITPEKDFFYTSIETNFIGEGVQDLTEKLIGFFRPSHFDFILFESQGFHQESVNLPDYFYSHSSSKALDCGYNVSYRNYHKKNSSTKQAQSL